jgi:GNAT superfamily N-acetyltransferase
MRWDASNGDWVSDDRSLIDVPLVHRWISELSYWGNGRSLALVEQSIRNSLSLGLYDADGSQVGVCRWVTDYATFAWLADVFIDPEQRGRGRGTFMVATASEHPEIAGLRLQLLGTRDAHGLYEKFGFSPVAPGSFMERRQPAAE